ncbi:DUF4085 family protein [Neobacillus sp. PS3-34]|uniref:DUF4085 family protein n=1 Tax=Neobacillus sp. PS3-34 TaxID=3070678 RepID=UPI0027E02B0E|nr:DUF4085 family protein [Neobacillus sp. PS3-34]WML48728.1 DUF4085 family protein [Neobacillus sp. PS3-34]
MKFFTKDWYEEMQILGFLMLPETKEEWDENIEDYEKYGMDYKRIFKEDVDLKKSDLLRFLPESFHPYINDYSINSEYPPLELRIMAEQWLKEYHKRMEILDQEYINHYKSIKDKLSNNVVQLHDNSLHDARVISYEIPSKDTFTIILDCRGGFHYFTDIKVTFTGVTELSIPNQLEGASWLYDEVYCTNTGFEYHVLFDCPLTEFNITAENVLIAEL